MKRNFDKLNSVSVEDLLRVKCCERPDAVVWSTFQRELHEKSLKTLVAKPSLFDRLLNRFALNPAFAFVFGVVSVCLLVVGARFGTLPSDSVSITSAHVDLESHSQAPAKSEILESSLETFTTGDERFVVASFAPEVGNQSDYTTVAVSYNMLKTASQRVHYVAGQFVERDAVSLVLP